MDHHRQQRRLLSTLKQGKQANRHLVPPLSHQSLSPQLTGQQDDVLPEPVAAECPAVQRAAAGLAGKVAISCFPQCFSCSSTLPRQQQAPAVSRMQPFSAGVCRIYIHTRRRRHALCSCHDAACTTRSHTLESLHIRKQCAAPSSSCCGMHICKPS